MIFYLTWQINPVLSFNENIWSMIKIRLTKKDWFYQTVLLTTSRRNQSMGIYCQWTHHRDQMWHYQGILRYSSNKRKMIYSTPYIGNYVCITLVMLETFLINGIYIGWSVLTVRDSYTTSLTVSYSLKSFPEQEFYITAHRLPGRLVGISYDSNV